VLKLFRTCLKQLFAAVVLLACCCSANNVLAQETIRLLVPGTPSAMPLIIASQKSGDVDVKVVQNLAQANAEFVRGDADLLLTGLSVGMKMFEQGVPVKMLASHVSSLSYLVVNKELTGDVNSFADLAGYTISFPFPGSPLEEVSRYFFKQDGLELGKDVKATYNALPLAVMLLKQGKLAAAPLPEPFCSLAVNSSDKLAMVIDYSKLWQSYTASDYPQVALFAKGKWLEDHGEWIGKFRLLIKEAIDICEVDPQRAVAMTRDSFKLPDDVLLSALKHSGFHLQTGKDLEHTVFTYYKLIGKDLEKQSQLQYGKLF